MRTDETVGWGSAELDVGRRVECGQAVISPDVEQDVTGESPFEVAEVVAGSVPPEPLFRLSDLTHDQRNTLERELKLASRIQKALLPRRNFFKGGWEVAYHYAPAGVLSGDYCDLFETETGFFFLLGDVSGKGVGASLLMSQLHAIFRGLTERDLPLDMMMEEANRLFSHRGVVGQFATLGLGKAEQDGSVQFVSAGHPALLHASKGVIQAKSATGVPLGMLRETFFEVHSFTTKRGDTLLAYSDGFTEARNSVGEEYGEHRLRKTVARNTADAPPQLIAQCVWNQFDFRGGRNQSDDVTLMAIRRFA